MTKSTLSDAELTRAQEFWLRYQREHDVTDRIGQAAGIDPGTGRIWFGESAIDITQQMDAEGCFRPFYCVRVGYEYYLRKGLRRDHGNR